MCRILQWLWLSPWLVAVLVCDSSVDGETFVLHEFDKVQLTREYFAEGASFGDFNHDGKTDIVCGPNWFEGPGFTERRRFYDGKAFPNDRGYSDNFFSFVHDYNGDGWDDILVVGLPGTAGHWYENPRQQDGEWVKRLAFTAVDNEAPRLDDLTGDGSPELVCTSEGRLGYVSPGQNGAERWHWTPISEKGTWHRYSHGLGIGDINGDGRNDFLMPSGWWEQPANPSKQQLWTHHPFKFCDGGAQIYAFDVDGDGDNDLVTSLQAHSWGLSWFEQIQDADQKITFREHTIMGAERADNPFGVRFSQLHAMDCVDVDGDGLRDIVTGKCYWAHNGSDPGAREPAVLYFFRLVRKNGEAHFVPHLIDANTGVGRQIHATDVNQDGLVDIITGNKKGTYIFLHKTRQVTKEEYEQHQPPVVAANADGNKQHNTTPPVDSSAHNTLNIKADVVYGHKFGLALTLDVYQPGTNANGAGVLFMVSGGWYSRWAPPENFNKLFEPLIDKGFTVFAVRHGSSPKFSIPEAVEDVRRSVRFVRLNAARFGIVPDRLGVFGMSAGGHLALMLGTASDQGNPAAKDKVLQTSDRVRSVVAFVAPTDLRGMVWESPDAMPAYKRFPALNLDVQKAAEMSPLLHVSSDDPPTLLLAGVKDDLVPIRHSQEIELAFKKHDVISRVVLYEQSGHGLVSNDMKSAMDELVKWFDTHLAEDN